MSGFTRSTSVCSGFLLVLIQGNPFALCMHCNGVCNNVTRSWYFAAGSEGAFLFKNMRNTTKQKLADQVAQLQGRCADLQKILELSEKLDALKEAKLQVYRSAFRLSPAEKQALPLVINLLERLQQLPFVNSNPVKS